MDESLFKTLQQLAMDGTLSQRELSSRMGLSLGKVNYVIKALLQKGHIKAQRFKNSKNKIAYMYVLTPAGINEKVVLTQRFLDRKLREYEELKHEIDALRSENLNNAQTVGMIRVVPAADAGPRNPIIGNEIAQGEQE